MKKHCIFLWIGKVDVVTVRRFCPYQNITDLRKSFHGFVYRIMMDDAKSNHCDVRVGSGNIMCFDGRDV